MDWPAPVTSEPQFDRFGQVARESITKGEIAGTVAPTLGMSIVRTVSLPRPLPAKR